MNILGCFNNSSVAHVHTNNSYLFITNYAQDFVCVKYFERFHTHFLLLFRPLRQKPTYVEPYSVAFISVTKFIKIGLTV
jgi:hypothetical protein